MFPSSCIDKSLLPYGEKKTFISRRISDLGFVMKSIKNVLKKGVLGYKSVILVTAITANVPLILMESE
jgi:hypothetical protein